MATEQEVIWLNKAFILCCCVVAVLFNVSMLPLIKSDKPDLVSVTDKNVTVDEKLVFAFTLFLATLGFWFPKQWIEEKKWRKN